MGQKNANASDDPKPDLNWDYVELLMRRLSFSQTSLAQVMGVSTETLRRAKTEGRATADTVAKLAHHLQVTPAELHTANYRQFLEAQAKALTSATLPPLAPSAPPLVGDPKKIAPSRIHRHASAKLFGRETDLAALDAAWAKPHLNVYTLLAWGGAGKTSLVAHWVSTRFEANGWPGVERYFDWSFYSQGTGESRQTSADQFIAVALTFFGDPDPTKGSPWERGERLAELVRKHRTLLVLDGIEPLQYPPNDPQAGRLKDPALESLLQSLAADNPGLVVVTTREHLTSIESHTATTEEQNLNKLPKEAAVALLQHLQIVGTDEEMEAAWKDAGGHALTLNLLGRFLTDAHDGDIRKYKEVDWEEVDKERQGRSAFKVMAAYEKWLSSAGDAHRRELDLLRLTGLFDRPIRRDCLDALLSPPAIHGLTYHLLKLKGHQRTLGLKRLSEIELLTVSSDAIDAHPLIREYFAQQLRDTQPEEFKEAHSRLFDYLCRTTKPHRPDTLDSLQPLYEAIVHGCLAGKHQKVCDEVYVDRVLRGTGYDGFHSTRRLGAFGADLSAVAAFFGQPWSKVSPKLSEADQAWLLSAAAFDLRALGRLTEALHPMRAGLEMHVQQTNWKQAAINASNLSELEGTLGRLTDAVADAQQSITYADRSKDPVEQMLNRSTAAIALHQSGQRAEASTHFAYAERMQVLLHPEINRIYSTQGFHYCDWLLAHTEQAVWQAVVRGVGVLPVEEHGQDTHATICDAVEHRASEAQRVWLEKFTNQPSLLTVALDHLTLARVGLNQAILKNQIPQPTLDLPQVAAAVSGLRNAGRMDHLPLGLLTASLYHFVRVEPDLARKYLNETQQIAERGPMPLFLADVHLHRARMFRDKGELAKAAKLIRDLGYGRRYDELADAEEAAKRWE